MFILSFGVDIMSFGHNDDGGQQADIERVDTIDSDAEQVCF